MISGPTTVDVIETDGSMPALIEERNDPQVEHFGQKAGLIISTVFLYPRLFIHPLSQCFDIVIPFLR